MAADDLTAELDRIAERATSAEIGNVMYGLERMVRKSDDWLGWLGGEDEGATWRATVEAGKLQGDAARAVAALRAVLELAGRLEPQGPPGSALEEDRMFIRQECADMIREAIGREITGAQSSAQRREESGDGG